MNKTEIQLAELDKETAESMAVEQFTDLYNEVEEKDLDMSKLELVLRSSFTAGVLWERSVIEKENEENLLKGKELIQVRRWVGKKAKIEAIRRYSGVELSKELTTPEIDVYIDKNLFGTSKWIPYHDIFREVISEKIGKWFVKRVNLCDDCGDSD